MRKRIRVRRAHQRTNNEEMTNDGLLCKVRPDLGAPLLGLSTYWYTKLMMVGCVINEANS